MPILDIEIVTRPGERLSPTLAADLANRAAEAFNSADGTTWVKLRALSHDQYGENGGDPSQGIYPVFVSVLKARQPSPEQLQVEINDLTAVVARMCNRPEQNVHILYLPEAAGRIAFGGTLVR